MKRAFITLTLFLLAVTLTSCSMVQRTSPEEIKRIAEQVENSKLVILDIYHDRCESCKSIEPVINQLEKDYEGSKDVVFLKYDLSNPITVLNSRKIAKATGLEDIYRSQRFSGVVLIIDSKKKVALETLVGEYNINKYYGAIQKDLALNDS